MKALFNNIVDGLSLYPSEEGIGSYLTRHGIPNQDVKDVLVDKGWIVSWRGSNYIENDNPLKAESVREAFWSVAKHLTFFPALMIEGLFENNPLMPDFHTPWIRTPEGEDVSHWDRSYLDAVREAQTSITNNGIKNVI